MGQFLFFDIHLLFGLNISQKNLSGSLSNEHGFYLSGKITLGLSDLLEMGKKFRHFHKKKNKTKQNNESAWLAHDMGSILHQAARVLFNAIATKLTLQKIYKNWFMLSVRISSYGCTREVWRAPEKLDLLLAIASSNSSASLVLSKLPACIHNSIYAQLKA